jgi:hypothetical protein
MVRCKCMRLNVSSEYFWRSWREKPSCIRHARVQMTDQPDQAAVTAITGVAVQQLDRRGVAR